MPAATLEHFFSRHTSCSTSSSSGSSPRHRRLKHATDNLLRQRRSFSLQRGLGRLSILLYIFFSCLHLRLRPAARLGYRIRPGLHRRLPPRFLGAKDSCPRLAQPLLILGGTRLGRGNVSSRLLDCPLRLAAPLLQHT